MRQYSFLREPTWVLITLLVPLLVIGALVAARWQYHRHVNRAADNVRIQQGVDGPAVPVTKAIEVGAPVSREARYRHVSVTGNYVVDATVLARRRTFDSRPGFWVMTPLVTSDGTGYLINRGWVPVGETANDTPQVTPPPAGVVQVSGWLQPAQQKAAFSPGLPQGQVNSVNAQEILSRQAPTASIGLDGYIQLQSSRPEQPGPAPGTAQVAPTALPLQSLGAGPHLAYSGQWVLIAVGIVAGYVLIVRREARDRRKADSESAP